MKTTEQMVGWVGGELGGRWEEEQEQMDLEEEGERSKDKCWDRINFIFHITPNLHTDYLQFNDNEG